MNDSRFLKKLKKWLRKRKMVSLAAWILAFGAVLNIAAYVSVQDAHAAALPTVVVMQKAFVPHTAVKGHWNDENRQRILSDIKQKHQSMQVQIQKQWICGLEVQNLGVMRNGDIITMAKEHPNWDIEIKESDQVLFIRPVRQVTADCSQRAYFGIDREGNLSLFDGLPEKDKVIRTFFQLDIKYMVSSLPKEKLDQLKSGIEVTNAGEYHHILSTFSQYAVNKKS